MGSGRGPRSSEQPRAQPRASWPVLGSPPDLAGKLRRGRDWLQTEPEFLIAFPRMIPSCSSDSGKSWFRAKDACVQCLHFTAVRAVAWNGDGLAQGHRANYGGGSMTSTNRLPQQKLVWSPPFFGPENKELPSGQEQWVWLSRVEGMRAGTLFQRSLLGESSLVPFA